MDFSDVQRIMVTKGFAADPAFENVRIGIEPIQCYNGCPLGLYFPDAEWSPYVQDVVPGGTIVIPPNATEATLLHELGHRHGHYYYNDLSEAYAEYFRRIYQPTERVMLYAGDDFSRLPNFGSVFEEGERGAVEVALLQPLMPEALSEIQGQLSSYDEPPPRCYYGNSSTPFIRFEFTKGIDWLTIIGATLAGLTAFTGGIVAYAIYKVAEEKPWITPIAVIGTVAGIVLGLGLGAKYAPQIKAQLGGFV